MKSFKINELKKIRLGFILALIGVILYPVVVFLGHITAKYIIDFLSLDISYPDYIRYILTYSPIFSILILIGGFLFTFPEFNFWGANIVKKFIRTLLIFYFILAFIISYYSLNNDIYGAVVYADLKSVIWRLLVCSYLVYLSIYFYYFELNKWMIYSIIILFLSLIQDFIYYTIKLITLFNVQQNENIETIQLIATIFIFVALIIPGFKFLSTIQKKSG